MANRHRRAIARFLAGFLFLCLASCASSGKYEKVLNSWVNADVNRLIQSWGPPSNEYRLPNGSVMYTWLWIGGDLVTYRYNELLGAVQAQTVSFWCKTTFTTSSGGTIQSWRWEGNACKSR